MVTFQQFVETAMPVVKEMFPDASVQCDELNLRGVATWRVRVDTPEYKPFSLMVGTRWDCPPGLDDAGYLAILREQLALALASTLDRRLEKI